MVKVYPRSAKRKHCAEIEETWSEGIEESHEAMLKMDKIDVQDLEQAYEHDRSFFERASAGKTTNLSW
jgi:hypothetical protein